jgi:glycosyltransferase involved in cell wall biosynthesis
MSSTVGGDDTELHLRIESELPREIAVGRGNVLTLYGWCFHSRKPIRRLEVLLDGEAQPLIAHGMPRPDVLHLLAQSTGGPDHAYRSGFWGLLSLDEIAEPREVEIRLRARLDGGDTVSKQAGGMRLLPGERRSWARVNGGSPQVAVCMATFNPPPQLFRQQIESIRAQTYENWICLINDDDSRPEAFEMIEQLVGDDPRFRVERNPRRLGYYRNFERVLASVPAESELVALADQDDHWHTDKLAALVEQISGDVTLAYSDMRVTDDNGNTISPTFWTERANNPNDLGALLIVNSVTGGSALFRSELLEYVLPFPTPAEGGLHDHWVALVANSLGRLAYVDRPLYDYIQHGGAALGHESLRRPVIRRGPGFLRAIRSGSAFRAAIARRLSRARNNYPVVLGARTSAQLLLMRGGKAIGARKRRTLRRWSRVESSPLIWPWLMLRARLRQSKTLGSERRLVAGSLWRATLSAVKMLRLPPPPPGRETLASIMKLPLSSEPVVATRLHRLIAPLRLEVSPDAPRRVNVLIPTIDLELFHGGYITEFNLARRLAESGVQVRVVSVDEPFYLPPSWPQDLERIEGLEGIMGSIEVEPLHDRSKALVVGPDDRFFATTWWTAQIAHRATRELGRERFLYLIGECEPLTLPLGSEAALARESYEFPHFGLFSSELLRDYFRAQRLGVFAGGVGSGGDASLAFEEAIAPIRPPTPEEMRNSERRLLFHTRPERHSERNLFELGLLALAEAREEGTLEGWQLHGIGARQPGEVRYGSDLRVKILERQDQSQYADLLRGHAVGLSLMLSPHPSLVPLEMASAGMPVVTNTFENKTGEALAEISENLIAIEPTIEGVKEGIRNAVAASTDHDRRLRGAQVDWSRSWEDSFSPELIERLRAFMEQA